MDLRSIGPDPLAEVASWPVEAAVAVTRPAATIGSWGRQTRARPWASVTKALVALGILVAVEEGSLDLDEPGGPPGCTLRHLLAHASGLDAGGKLRCPPGRRRIYANANFELLGEALAVRTGMVWTDYVGTGILDPLGMSRTRLRGSPAAGASGPLVDLVLLARELMAPTLVSRATLTEATTPAWPDLAGFLPGYGPQRPNDWGLGFEVRGHKTPHWTGPTNSPSTFGHFGQSGSFLWIDPEAGLACCGLAAEPWGPWAREVWPPLADAVVATWGVPPTGPEHP